MKVSSGRKFRLVYGVFGLLRKWGLVGFSLIGKGLNLGIVLFVALLVLSVLYSAMNEVLGLGERHEVIKREVTSGYGGQKGSRPQYAPGSFVTSRVVNRGAGGPGCMTAQDTVRESRYWLGSLDEVMRTISRFSRS